MWAPPVSGDDTLCVPLPFPLPKLSDAPVPMFFRTTIYLWWDGVWVWEHYQGRGDKSPDRN